MPRQVELDEELITFAHASIGITAGRRRCPAPGGERSRSRNGLVRISIVGHSSELFLSLVDIIETYVYRHD